MNLAGQAVSGQTDQRSKIGTVNVAPSFTHVVSADSVWNLGAIIAATPTTTIRAEIRSPTWGRFRQRDHRTESQPGQCGLHTDFTYEKGHHNVKAGAMYEQTFLNENDTLGIVDPGYLDSLDGCQWESVHVGWNAGCAAGLTVHGPVSVRSDARRH